jgi:acyl-CoA synthetase (AMP-forming)/AMP-acid ligase II
MNRPAAVIVQGAALKSEIPFITVPQLVRDRARQWPDRVAFIDGPTGRPYSYGDLDRSIGLWFRGPQAFQGYRNQPSATAATITEDGWVRNQGVARRKGGRLQADRRHRDLRCDSENARRKDLASGHPRPGCSAARGVADLRRARVASIAARRPRRTYRSAATGDAASSRAWTSAHSET